MKVSVITTCKNSAFTIETTIKSVLAQDYPDIEYIIIDGASTDGTLEIIKKYSSKISSIVSEADEGIYHAINKGICISTGVVVANLNSDDFYSSPTVLSQVVSAFKNSEASAVYGNLLYVDKKDTNRVIRNWQSGAYSEGLFLKGWMPPHPAFFAKKELYDKYGMFNTKLKSAADYEIMLRFIHKHKIKVAYVPEVLVKMRTGGKSNASLLNRIKANLEDRRAWKINELNPGLFTLLLKPLRKINQYWG
ncbi:MAG: glycosyltransferase [Bacteroidia bacterium]|nr:glycosyltransferase [Bacteroidia bacterium]